MLDIPELKSGGEKERTIKIVKDVVPQEKIY